MKHATETNWFVSVASVGETYRIYWFSSHHVMFHVSCFTLCRCALPSASLLVRVNHISSSHRLCQLSYSSHRVRYVVFFGSFSHKFISKTLPFVCASYRLRLIFASFSLPFVTSRSISTVWLPVLFFSLSFVRISETLRAGVFFFFANLFCKNSVINVRASKKKGWG